MEITFNENNQLESIKQLSANWKGVTMITSKWPSFRPTFGTKNVVEVMKGYVEPTYTSTLPVEKPIVNAQFTQPEETNTMDVITKLTTIFGKNIDIPKLPKEEDAVYKHRIDCLRGNLMNFNNNEEIIQFFKKVENIIGVRIVGEENHQFIARNEKLLTLVNCYRSRDFSNFDKYNFSVLFGLLITELPSQHYKETVHCFEMSKDKQSQRYNPLIHSERVGLNESISINCLGGKWTGEGWDL
jgi:hypothetical protein